MYFRGENRWERGGGNGVLGRCHLLNGDQLDISFGRNCAERVVEVGKGMGCFCISLIGRGRRTGCANPIQR